MPVPPVIPDQALAGAVSSPGLIQAGVRPQWQSIPGSTHGGVVIAAAVAAASGLVLPAHRLRAVTAHFVTPVAPAPQITEFTAQLERQSSRTSTATLRVAQQGTPRMVGVATFAARSQSPSFDEVVFPDVPGPEELADLELPAELVPFTQHFRWRVAGPERPMGSGEVARFTAWMALRSGAPVDTGAALIILDAPPPALYSKLAEMRPMPSVDFTAHFLGDLDESPEPGWVLIDERSVGTRDGHSIDDAMLWRADGRLLATARQIRRLR